MLPCKTVLMRADRLVSLVLLLRQQGRMTAEQLSRKLEVSTRTILRDIEALSVSGVPIYADRGRYGGFSLLPGFRTELTGLNHDEALALITAGSFAGTRAFGLDSTLASATRKVIDALPDEHQADLSQRTARFLVEPNTDLLSRATDRESIPQQVMAEVRAGVLHGRKLRFRYAAPGKEPRWHTVDPIGLVTVRERTYLLAIRSEHDRTYRVARILEAEQLDEPADRPAQIDLEQLWSQRSARFLSDSRLPVTVHVRRSRKDELLDAARAVLSENEMKDDWLRVEVEFEDLRHAVWAVWQLDADAVVEAPATLRSAVSERAELVAARYRTQSIHL